MPETAVNNQLFYIFLICFCDIWCCLKQKHKIKIHTSYLGWLNFITVC